VAILCTIATLFTLKAGKLVLNGEYRKEIVTPVPITVVIKEIVTVKEYADSDLIARLNEIDALNRWVLTRWADGTYDLVVSLDGFTLYDYDMKSKEEIINQLDRVKEIRDELILRLE